MNPTTGPRSIPTTSRGSGRGARPRVAGWVYQVHIVGDPNMYVGQSKRAPGRRVDEHRRTMPWGHLILPGRDGYTIIRKVESSGDPTIDEIALDLAEAQEIRRLNPTDNINRPDPAVFAARLQAARNAVAVTPGDPWGPNPFGGGSRPRPTTATPRRVRGGRPVQPRGVAARRTPLDVGMILRVVGFVLCAVPCAVIAAIVGQSWPHPAAPWVAAPIAAVLGPVMIAHAVRRSWGPRPRRRRRRRH